MNQQNLAQIMMMQLLSGMTNANPAAAAGEASTRPDEEPDKKKYKKGGDAKLDSSASFLFSLPEIRLQKLIEFLHPPFDIIATDQFPKPVLLRMIWMIAGVKPNLNVNGLRHLTYDEFNDKIKVAMERYKVDIGARAHDQILLTLMNRLTQERVVEFAAGMHFDEVWLTKPKAKAKAKTLALPSGHGQAQLSLEGTPREIPEAPLPIADAAAPQGAPMSQSGASGIPAPTEQSGPLPAAPTALLPPAQPIIPHVASPEGDSAVVPPAQLFQHDNVYCSIPRICHQDQNCFFHEKLAPPRISLCVP